MMLRLRNIITDLICSLLEFKNKDIQEIVLLPCEAVCSVIEGTVHQATGDLGHQLHQIHITAKCNVCTPG